MQVRDVSVSDSGVRGGMGEKSVEMIYTLGVSFVPQQLTNATRIYEDTGLIPDLTQQVKDPRLESGVAVPGK